MFVICYRYVNFVSLHFSNKAVTRGRADRSPVSVTRWQFPIPVCFSSTFAQLVSLPLWAEKERWDLELCLVTFTYKLNYLDSIKTNHCAIIYVKVIIPLQSYYPNAHTHTHILTHSHTDIGLLTRPRGLFRGLEPGWSSSSLKSSSFILSLEYSNQEYLIFNEYSLILLYFYLIINNLQTVTAIFHYYLNISSVPTQYNSAIYL